MLALIFGYLMGSLFYASVLYLKNTHYSRGERRQLLEILKFMDAHEGHPAKRWIDVAGIHEEAILLDEFLKSERSEFVKNVFWLPMSIYAYIVGFIESWKESSPVSSLWHRDPHKHLDLGKIREEEGRRI